MKINTITLRLILGWLGIALPWIVLLLSIINGYGVPDSISATYYLAPCITPFMIILGAASIFLICYSGYDKQDDLVSTFAGICGLCICIFPCSNRFMRALGFIPETVGTFQLDVELSGWIHNISAIVFFLLLAYNTYFLFTKGSDYPTPNKKKRNIIYRACGIGMLVALICIIPLSIFKVWGGTWLVEAIALSFFGLSWLTKSDVYPWLYCDTPFTD